MEHIALHFLHMILHVFVHMKYALSVVLIWIFYNSVVSIFPTLSLYDM